eukprot:3047603-Rhodomonas_salina.2
MQIAIVELTCTSLRNTRDRTLQCSSGQAFAVSGADIAEHARCPSPSLFISQSRTQTHIARAQEERIEHTAN